MLGKSLVIFVPKAVALAQSLLLMRSVKAFGKYKQYQLHFFTKVPKKPLNIWNCTNKLHKLRGELKKMCSKVQMYWDLHTASVRTDKELTLTRFFYYCYWEIKITSLLKIDIRLDHKMKWYSLRYEGVSWASVGFHMQFSIWKVKARHGTRV